MKKMLTILLVLATILNFTACNVILGITPEENTDASDNTEENIEENEETKIPSGDKNEVVEKKTVQKQTIKDIYKTFPGLQEETPIEKFTDQKNNYFFFKIGEVARVPIACSSTLFYQGYGTRTLKFSTTESVENTITSAVNTCLSNTVKSGVTSGLNSSIGIKNGALTGTANAMLQTEMSSSSTASTSKSFTQSIGDKFTQYKEDVFELDPSCPAGFYRYTVYANCEIYTAIKANIDEQSFEYTYLCFVKKQDTIEGWMYSEDGYYETDENIYKNLEKLSLEEDMLKNIDLYGKLDKVRIFKEMTYNFAAPSTLKEDYEYTVNINLKQFDFDMIQEIGYKKAKIEISYDVNTPDGECKSRCFVYANEKNVYKSDWRLVDESVERHVVKCEVAVSELITGNYKIEAVFRCLRDGVLDLLKNEYYIKNGVVKVTFE